MKKAIILLILSFGFAKTYAQNDNPYSVFGYQGKVLKTPEEESGKQYLIINTNDTTQQLKSLVFNSFTNKIEYIDHNDNIYKSDTLLPTLILRFISTDRLADKYPSQSPYVYASNMPIAAIDANGDSTYLVIYGAGYLNYQSQGGADDLGITFKLHATQLEKQIRNSTGFDPKNDNVIVVYAPSTDQFVNATNAKYASGAIKQMDVFSHGGSYGLSLGGRAPTDPGSNQTTADADLNNYDRREINSNTVGQIDFSNFGPGSVCTFNGCSIGGYYSTNATTREQNAQNSFGQGFSNTSGGTTRAFTGDAETQVLNGTFQYGTMIRSVDKGSQTQNYTIFTPNTTPNPPAAVVK